MKAQIVSGEFCLCPNTPTENKFIINMSNTTVVPPMPHSSQ